MKKTRRIIEYLEREIKEEKYLKEVDKLFADVFLLIMRMYVDGYQGVTITPFKVEEGESYESKDRESESDYFYC